MRSFEELSLSFSTRFETDHFPTTPDTLYGPNRYFLKLGGKRVRPVLCLMGHELFDELNEDTWQLATAVELFHNFTLIHDDIMDQAPLRRGKPTVHEKWNANIAILSGDVMLVRAYDLLLPTPTALLPEAIRLFNKTAAEVCEGQQYDMDYASYETVSLSSYLEMIRLKTAVLLGGAMQLGAIVADASEKQLEQVQHFAESMGLAFQIKDDIFDYGDDKKIGKPTGNDIRERKMTLPLIYALNNCDKTTRKELINIVKNHNEEPKFVRKAIDHVVKSGGVKYAYERMIEIKNEALALLDGLEDSNSKKALIGLVENTVYREK